MDKICKQLDKVRKKRGLSYADLAHQTDLSRPTLSMVFETLPTSHSNPRLSTLRKLMKVLGCRLELIEEE